MSEASDRKIVRYIRNIGIACLNPGADAEKGQMLISKNGGCFLMPQEQISIALLGVKTHPLFPQYGATYPSCLKIKFNDETIRFYTHNISDTEEVPSCLGKFHYEDGGIIGPPTVTFTPNWYYMSSEIMSSDISFEIYASLGWVNTGVDFEYTATLITLRVSGGCNEDGTDADDKDIALNVCSSCKKPGLLAKVTYSPGNGTYTVDTSVAKTVDSPTECTENTRIFKISAPYRWCSDSGEVYTEQASPLAGNYIFGKSYEEVEIEVEEGMSDADIQKEFEKIKKSKSVGTVAQTLSVEYIVTETGMYYWLESDSINYHPLTVTAASWEYNTNEIACYTEYNADTAYQQKTTGRIFSTATQNSNLTGADAAVYSIKTVKVSDGETYGTVNYWGRTEDPEEYPAFVQTGNTKTVQYFVLGENDDEIMSYTVYEYKNKNGEGGWSFQAPTVLFTSISTGVWTQEDFDEQSLWDDRYPGDIGYAEVGKPYVQYGAVLYHVRSLSSDGFMYNGYPLSLHDVSVPPDYYVYVGCYYWKQSPCFGTSELYTNEDKSEYGSTPKDVATENTSPVQSSGTGIYSITDNMGRVYVSAANDADGEFE